MAPQIITQDTVPILIHHHHQEAPVEKRRSVGEAPDIPISITTMIQGTMIMMATLIAIFGYRACMQGEFECTIEHFPDISHVMGVAPLNKLYSIMFVVYSFSK